MRRDDVRRRLEDIVERIAMIRSFVDGYDAERFAGDAKTFEAVVRCLEVVGAAVRNVPEHVLAREPSIPWRQIKAARNVLAHDYQLIDDQAVWRMATTRLDELEPVVRRLLGSL